MCDEMVVLAVLCATILSTPGANSMKAIDDTHTHTERERSSLRSNGGARSLPLRAVVFPPFIVVETKRKLRVHTAVVSQHLLLRLLQRTLVLGYSSVSKYVHCSLRCFPRQSADVSCKWRRVPREKSKQKPVERWVSVILHSDFDYAKTTYSYRVGVNNIKFSISISSIENTTVEP